MATKIQELEDLGAERTGRILLQNSEEHGHLAESTKALRDEMVAGIARVEGKMDAGFAQTNAGLAQAHSAIALGQLRQERTDRIVSWRGIAVLLFATFGGALVPLLKWLLGAP